MTQSSLYRYTDFTDPPDGGNPAGVWIGEALGTNDGEGAYACLRGRGSALGRAFPGRRVELHIGSMTLASRPAA